MEKEILNSKQTKSNHVCELYIFRMSYADFTKYFNHVDICHVMNTSFFSLSKTWSEAIGKGQWVKPTRCGGSITSPNFLKNPQVCVD